MNANLGIVLRKQDRVSAFQPIALPLRTWGDEVVVVDAPQRFSVDGLSDVEFEIFAVTKFIRNQLPIDEQSRELEYAWMTGAGLDAYEAWARTNDDGARANSFETTFRNVLNRLCFCAVMLAPESDRLGFRAHVSSDEMIHMLRHGLRDLASCKGFLVIIDNSCALG